jgi:hypothetical protein
MFAAYTHQLAERTSNHKIPPYDYAMSQIGHEMGHRWAAFASAKVGTETIVLGPTHWATGLQAPPESCLVVAGLQRRQPHHGSPSALFAFRYS